MLPFPADVPPQIRERVMCSISAAVKYEVPANIVLAVAEKEGGKPGQWVRNRNGTHDVGPMQFNTAYLAELAGYGITATDVAAAGCYPFDLAAWRLRMHLRTDKGGDLWTKAANYHSRTPQYNAAYRADLMRRAAKWADWLHARFATVDVKQNPPAWMSGKQAAAELVNRRPMAGTAGPPAGKPVARGPAAMAGYLPRTISFNTKEREDPR